MLVESLDLEDVRQVSEIKYGGECEIYRSQTYDLELLIKRRTLADKSQLAGDVKKLTFEKELRHPNLLSLVQFCVETNTTFCSENYVIREVYEYAELDLLSDLRAR